MFWYLRKVNKSKYYYGHVLENIFAVPCICEQAFANTASYKHNFKQYVDN